MRSHVIIYSYDSHLHLDYGPLLFLVLIGWWLVQWGKKFGHGKGLEVRGDMWALFSLLLFGWCERKGTWELFWTQMSNLIRLRMVNSRPYVFLLKVILFILLRTLETLLILWLICKYSFIHGFAPPWCMWMKTYILFILKKRLYVSIKGHQRDVIHVLIVSFYKCHY